MSFLEEKKNTPQFNISLIVLSDTESRGICTERIRNGSFRLIELLLHSFQEKKKSVPDGKKSK